MSRPHLVGKVSELALETADGMRTLRDQHSLTIKHLLQWPCQTETLSEKILLSVFWRSKEAANYGSKPDESPNETFHIESRLIAPPNVARALLPDAPLSETVSTNLLFLSR